MKRAIVILLLLAHVLTLGAIRCRTVWHEPSAVATADVDNCRHVLSAALADGEHAHDGGAREDELPAHSHVAQRAFDENAPRASSDGIAIAVPADYAELSRLLTRLDVVESRDARADNARPFDAPPLAGRTSNLLF